MKLHHLRPGDGAKRPRRRVGRGRAAGQGKTAGRGTKGYLARHNSRIGFEGGQMPIQRRVPKLKGFTNPNRVEWAVVNVERLGEEFDARTNVTPELLRERGLVRKALPIKVLGNGELNKPLTVSAHAVSESARGKIEGAGGRVEILPSPVD
ncbi:MAG TPA: 50S ribosomal protein L15 [Actinomycetota bacterium]|nr:50S ribosomal protein L15 [Actinomycetota bacterium]